jgi:hypothetical protein
MQDTLVCIGYQPFAPDDLVDRGVAAERGLPLAGERYVASCPKISEDDAKVALRSISRFHR